MLQFENGHWFFHCGLEAVLFTIKFPKHQSVDLSRQEWGQCTEQNTREPVHPIWKQHITDVNGCLLERCSFPTCVKGLISSLFMEIWELYKAIKLLNVSKQCANLEKVQCLCLHFHCYCLVSLNCSICKHTSPSVSY